MDFKQVFGFLLLFSFVVFLGNKLLVGTDMLQNNVPIIGFVIVVILLLVLAVRRILLS